MKEQSTKFETLKSSKDFDLVNKKGKKIVCRNLIVIISETYAIDANRSQSYAYLGMKVSKKYSTKAVERNLAKRRIRALFQACIKNTQTLTGAGITVIPRMSLQTTPFLKVHKDFIANITTI